MNVMEPRNPPLSQFGHKKSGPLPRIGGGGRKRSERSVIRSHNGRMGPNPSEWRMRNTFLIRRRPMTTRSRCSNTLCPNDRSPELNPPKSQNGPTTMACPRVFCRHVDLNMGQQKVVLTRPCRCRYGGCPATGIC